MKYSIITPAYNRADCIGRCMESVTRNIVGRNDVEQIVVDDGSIDDTADIVRQYVAEHPHVRFIQFTQNRGTNAARNAAINAAQGQFCIILDSDDYWDDEALNIIDSTVLVHSDIRHFCFAPDDMQPTYEQNPLLAGKLQCMLTFEGFLMERVCGDFVHVIETNILRRHPFVEELRIYEGVFFMEFYKEAQHILFTNSVVSHRERSRNDSVTREVLRTNKDTIKRTLIAEELFVKKFASDLSVIRGGCGILWTHQLCILENSLLLNDYAKANQTIFEIERIRLRKVPSRLKWIYRLRLGLLYYIAGKAYLQVKYNLLKVKLK